MKKLLLALTLATGAALVSCGGGGGGGDYDFGVPGNPGSGGGNPPGSGNPPSGGSGGFSPIDIGYGTHLSITSFTTNKTTVKTTNDSFTISWSVATDASYHTASLSLIPGGTLSTITCYTNTCQITCRTFFSSSLGIDGPKIFCDNGILEVPAKAGSASINIEACIVNPETYGVICDEKTISITFVN